MQRRSFFGVVFGGFLAHWLPQRRTLTLAELNQAYEQAVAADPLFVSFTPEYRFGFTGFTPATADRPSVSHPQTRC